MARPSTADLSLNQSLSPYQTPPNGAPAQLGAVPLNYAGQPIPPAPAANAVPTPAGLLNAFKRRWVLGTFMGLLCAAAAGSALWFVLPGGKHEARGLINLRDKNLDIGNKNQEDYEAYKRNQIFILKTRDLLNRTANDPAVASLEMMKNAEDPVRLIEENLSITAAAHSILTVTMKGGNVEDMKVIVDALMKRYVEDATATDRRDRDEKIKRLETLKETTRTEMESRERQLRMMVRSTGAQGNDSATQAQDTLLLRMIELDRKITDTNDTITALESKLKTARNKLALRQPGVPEAFLAQAINNDPRVVKMVLERDKLNDSFTREKENAVNPDQDPGLLKMKDDLAKLDAAIENKKKQLRNEIEAVQKDRALALLQAEVGTLEDQIITLKLSRETWKLEHDSIQKGRVVSAESNISVAQARKELEPMRTAIDQIESQLVYYRAQKSVDDRTSIREYAQAIPSTTSKKTLFSGMGGIATFFVVVLLVAFLEWRTRRVDGVDQVVNELGMRIIGTVPVFPNRASLKAAAETGGANWRFALNESINSTRTMLLHSTRAQSMQVVMVTSATQGEGKTSLASQLASSMATAGMRTLIVDCDLRNPSIHKLFDLGLTAGVSEILTQEADPTDAIQPTAIPNLWVIPAGQCSNRVIAALAQGHPLETLFNRLRGQFDFVIVDSCPVLPVADALLIGQHVDGVVFSIMQDISQIPKVLLASEKLNQLNVPLLGAVVNGIKQDVYSYGYNYVKQLPA
jgi:capsular exopolysaccharide synthesis family protein